MLSPWKESYNQLSILKRRDITLPTKVCLVKAMVFPVAMYGCESWTIKKGECWRIDASELLEKTLESPLDCKEIQPVHPKGNQSWTFIGRTDDEAETPILWPPFEKNWLIGKDPDARKDWRQEEKGMREGDNEMFGWHHRLDGQEFEQAPVVGDGQGSLACCSPWGHEELDTTEWLNWTEGLPWWLSGKESTCSAGATGDDGSVPGSGISPGGAHSKSHQYSCLKNPHGQRHLAG